MTPEEINESAAVLDATASLAASTFYENAARYGGVKRPKDIKRSSSWKKFVRIAQLCLARKIPVDSYVTMAYVDALERHSLVMVQDILAYDMSRAVSPKTSGPSPQDMWNMLSCKLLDMVFTLDGVKGKSEILDNAIYGFPAWFRVFSPKSPDNAILVHWGDLAYEELAENPALDKYLMDKRPKTHRLLTSVMSKI